MGASFPNMQETIQLWSQEIRFTCFVHKHLHPTLYCISDPLVKGKNPEILADFEDFPCDEAPAISKTSKMQITGRGSVFGSGGPWDDAFDMRIG